MSKLTKDELKIVKKAYKVGEQAGKLAGKQAKKAGEFEELISKIIDGEIASNIYNNRDDVADLVNYGNGGISYEDFVILIEKLKDLTPNDVGTHDDLSYLTEK